MSENQANKVLHDFLATHKVMTIASADNNIPYVANLFYVVDKQDQLYFLSSRKTRHALEFVKNSQVAVSIYDEQSSPGVLVSGIQALGSVKEVKGLALVKYFKLYLAKFPATKLTLAMLKQVSLDSRLYQFSPQLIYFTDKRYFPERKEFKL